MDNEATGGVELGEHTELGSSSARRDLSGFPLPVRLSKSKMIAGRQCERRIWLEVNRPDLREFNDAQSARLSQGIAFGELARGLLGTGELVECGFDVPAALSRTTDLLGASRPPRHLFEAALCHRNVFVRVDALRRVGQRFDLIEVKAGVRVKDYFLDDCAVQTWVARGAGIDIRRTQLALVNRDFVYAREGDYSGLLRLVDVSALIEARIAQAPAWLRRFRTVLAGSQPAIATGAHCSSPYGCPFIDHCQQGEAPGPEFPLSLLPNGAALGQRLAIAGYSDLRKVPSELLTRVQHQRMAQASRTGQATIDPALRKELAALPYPRRYLDFESIQFTVPRWLGTQPFDQVPFQWSCRIEKSPAELESKSFLDVSGSDPRREFAERLVKACGKRGPIVVYNRSFEASVIAALARQFPHFADALSAINERLVDLLPLMRKHYYHPNMRGSWSLKSVLPAVVPELCYDNLGEVADGQAAQSAYVEAIDPATAPTRRTALKHSLLRYCERDTEGLLAIVRRLSGDH